MTVVIVGGLAKAEKLRRLERDGIHIEWIETEGVSSVAPLKRRIGRGGVDHVIVLEGLMKHMHSEGIIAAAREHGVKVSRGGRGGIAKLKELIEG